MYGTSGSCGSPPNCNTTPPTNLGTLSYAYDADSGIAGKGGSLAAVNLPSAVSNNTYSHRNQILTWNGTSATSDADNELTTNPSDSLPYHWNERQELQHVASPDWNFYYDSAGRRETFDAFGVDTSYLYHSVFAAQSTTSGTPGSTQNYLTTPGGQVLAYSVTSGSTTTTTVPLTDLLGSTLGMVNSAGSLFTTFTYEPFGKPTGGQTTTYPYLFAGMEYDQQTELYHTFARYYSPILQRFVSEDPLNFGGGDVNLFGYAGNDPVDGTDTFGLVGPPVVGAPDTGGVPSAGPPSGGGDQGPGSPNDGDQSPDDDDQGPGGPVGDRAGYAHQGLGGGSGETYGGHGFNNPGVGLALGGGNAATGASMPRRPSGSALRVAGVSGIVLAQVEDVSLAVACLSDPVCAGILLISAGGVLELNHYAKVVGGGGKGERSWEKGRGDDPYYEKTPEQLREIEKDPNSTPQQKARARRIRKQKGKKLP
jgi:RHS repeat-associated protein